jgi:hypothetical protein
MLTHSVQERTFEKLLRAIPGPDVFMSCWINFIAVTE